MNCASCQTQNSDDARFCMQCGASLGSGCPQCGAALSTEARFCQKCGHQLAGTEPEPAESRLHQYIPKELLAKLQTARAAGGLQGERRIVTMLFCDVQGSTAAAEKLDPEEWAEIMNGAFEHLIAPVYRYEGTLARLMGDAILAFFGAPITHEDDPQRAVLAALDILERSVSYREEVQRSWGVQFNVRVGINTGLVVVGEVGSDLRVEYTAMGDAVNLAARMEQTAEPGTVQIKVDPIIKGIIYLTSQTVAGRLGLYSKHRSQSKWQTTAGPPSVHTSFSRTSLTKPRPSSTLKVSAGPTG